MSMRIIREHSVKAFLMVPTPGEMEHLDTEMEWALFSACVEMELVISGSSMETPSVATSSKQLVPLVMVMIRKTYFKTCPEHIKDAGN